MQRWQYRMLKVPLGGNDVLAKLNEAGWDGWEVVAYVQEQSSASVSGSRYAGTLVLKRPIPGER